MVQLDGRIATEAEKTIGVSKLMARVSEISIKDPPE